MTNPWDTIRKFLVDRHIAKLMEPANNGERPTPYGPNQQYQWLGMPLDNKELVKDWYGKEPYFDNLPRKPGE